MRLSRSRPLRPAHGVALAASCLMVVAALGPASESRAQERTAPTVVILVRHAEKADTTSSDPALSSEGEARAKALAHSLRDAGVSAIIATQFRRTQHSARPLATLLHITPDIVQTGGAAPSHAERVAAAVRDKHAGKVVLVVGHSNSIPAIIAALGGPRIPNLCESDYDNLFVLTLSRPAPPQLIRSRFGAADSVTEESCQPPTR